MSGAGMPSLAHRCFRRITGRPLLVLALGLTGLVVAASGLGNLSKETSVDAFIPSDHPSVLARDRATEVFGLRDPIAVALTTETPNGAWTQENLDLLRELHHAIAALDNVRDDRVTSLVSESQIRGDEQALHVDPILDDDLSSAEAVRTARERTRSMPPLLGTLVAEDGSALMIVAELHDPALAADTYEQVVALCRPFEGPGRSLHVAGQGALSGYLSRYIDRDARTMLPLVLAVIWCLLFLAFYRLGALLAPLVVIIAAAAGSLGLMAWAGVPYYAITSALPVVVMAIAVADSIHILTAYFEHRARDPKASVRDAVVAAMVEMWRPVTLTTVTTIAGFSGLAAASIMPPIRHFGVFAAVGVAIAWLFSMTVLPALLTLLRLPLPHRLKGGSANSSLGRRLTGLALAVHRRPALAGSALAALAFVAVTGASQLRVDRNQVQNFQQGEPIRQAHVALNRDFAGTSYLDVMVETGEAEGALAPEVLARVVELQGFLEGQPHVQKTLAITDTLALLHDALDPTVADPNRRSLPTSHEAIAQYLLLYEISGDADDLAEEIDTDRQALLVRAYLNTSLFSEQRRVVEATEIFLAQQPWPTGVQATLTGRVHVDYHWMTRLERSHVRSIAVSLLLVTLTSAWLFRSLRLGLLAALPVLLAALTVYGVMGFAGVFLEPATSMFAAIAIGVGIDFSIHLIDRLRAETSGSIREALELSFPAATRACFFNAVSLAAGFAVLWSSELPTLTRFGTMITVACLFSFFVALIAVPLFARVIRPDRRAQPVHRVVIPASLMMLCLSIWSSPVDAQAASESTATETTPKETTVVPPPDFVADSALTGRQIAERIQARPESPFTRRSLEMELIHKGKTRTRKAEVLRIRDDEARRALIRFTEPKNVADMAFLSFDAHDPQAGDEQWLYLPALGKVRRIPAAGRGDRFLGTELTYEDLKAELRFPLEEYHFEAAGQDVIEGRQHLLLDGRPISKDLAKTLGFDRFRAWVDPASWMPRRVDFETEDGRSGKRIEVLEMDRRGGYWTPLLIHVRSSPSGRETLFRYVEVSFPETLDADLLTPERLEP